MDHPSITAVPPTESRISGKFWTYYMELIRTRVVPYQWEALNDRIPGADPSYCMQNFRIAAGKELGTHRGFVFQDSDAAKWIEAAAYTLMWHPDPKLEATVDAAINEIVAIQQPDGYLNTYYIINGMNKRFTNLKDNHELYCLGHFIEAAVAYYQATGKDRLLKAMMEYADLVDRTFGPEPYKRQGYPGHEEIELALIRLFQVTGKVKYLKLSQYFIDQRGQRPNYFKLETQKHKNSDYWKDGIFKDIYYQDHKPVREQDQAVGHAVRAVYLYTGMASVAQKTGDPSLVAACRRLWKNLTQKQLYLTGAIGSSHYGEAFSYDYDLPSDTVYGETCAAIGLCFFAQSMLKIAPRGEYADVFERALYNAVLSGMSQDGTSFFYVNPLEANPAASEKSPYHQHVKISRQKWFGCACCPPNIARFISSLSGYVYTKHENILYVNQYLSGTIQTALVDGTAELSVKTNYPWEEDITVTLTQMPAAESAIALRIPGWCPDYQVQLNGQELHTGINNGYIYLKGNFQPGDILHLKLSMPVTVMTANPNVREVAGKLAVTRGPIVYCLEEADNGPELQRVRVSPESVFHAHYQSDFFGGAVLIKSEGRRVERWTDAALYRPAVVSAGQLVQLKWIPYYLWANRSPGEMTVWVQSL